VSIEPVPSFRKVGWVRAGLGALTAVLVFLVALGSSRSFARVSPTPALLDFSSIVGDVLIVFLGFLFIGFCVLAYYLLAGMGMRRPTTGAWAAVNPMPWWANALAMAFSVAAIGGLIAALLSAKKDNSTAAEPVPMGPLGGQGQPISRGANVHVHWWFLGGLAFVGLTALVVVRVRRRRRSAPQIRGVSPERDELRAVVEASLEELEEEEQDPRRAVVQAYVNMERVLAAQGLARRPSEAPFEYLARWTDAVRVGRRPAEALTALYERARFSLHLVDKATRQEAVEALVVLRGELAEGT
jgi:hypothetical protein